MKTWKQALWLAKFEWKVSAVNIFLCWIILSVIGLLYLTSFSGYLENNYVGFDIAFLLGFSAAPYWFRSKHFQYKEVSDHLHASPVLIMQTQLPIPKDVLAKSKLITYLAYLLPFMLTIFPVLYFINDSIRTTMDLPSYIVFSLIWIFYGLTLGVIFPASDAGDYTSPKILFYYLLATSVVLMGLLLLFYFVFGYGIVAWTIMLAKDWTILVIITLVMLTIVSWRFWPYYMKKTMQKLDYM